MARTPRGGGNVLAHQEKPKEHAGEPDDGAQGEVDASGDDDEAHADAEDRQQREVAEVVLDVVDLGELGADQRKNPDHDRQENGNSRDFAHQSASLLVARKITASSDRLSLFSSPLGLPSCITTTLSLIPRTSSISLLTMRMETPSRVSLHMRE